MKRTLGVAALLAVAMAACGGQSSSDGSAGSSGSAGSGGTGGGSASGGSGGASASGGSSGSGGSGAVSGSPGTGGSVAGVPECTNDSECRLFSDCCTCQGLAPDEPDPPSCFADCDQDACSAAGVKAATCQAGRCVTGYDCDSSTVVCNALPPLCEGGMLPSVVNGCWGACVPTAECHSVPSCDDCAAPLETCVRVDHQTGPTNHCVEIPKGCEGTPFCACMGGSVCVSPYDTCSDLSSVKGMGCSCPTC